MDSGGSRSARASAPADAPQSMNTRRNPIPRMLSLLSSAVGAGSRRQGTAAVADGSPPHRLALGGAWAVFSKVSGTLLTLIVNALLTRVLSPEQAGAFFLTFSMVTLAQTAASLGLNRAVVRLVAESMATDLPGRARAVVGTVLRYGSLGALATGAFLAVGGGRWIALRFFGSPLMADAIWPAAAWAVVLTYEILLTESLRGFHDIRLATLFTGPVPSLFTGALLAVVWLGPGRSDLSRVIIISLVGAGASVMVAGALLHRKLRSLHGGEPIDDRVVLGIARSFWISGIWTVAVRYAGMWILGAIGSQEDVALYGVASRLVNVVASTQALVVTVVPPWIASMYAQGKTKALERMVRSAALLAGVPSIAALTVFILFGRPLLGVVYGDYYRQAVTALVILSVGRFVNVSAGPCQIVLMMTGREVLQMWWTIASGAVTIVLAFALVGRYGASGIAFATAIGMVFQNVASMLSVKATIGIWTCMGHAAGTWRYMKEKLAWSGES